MHFTQLRAQPLFYAESVPVSGFDDISG